MQVGKNLNEISRPELVNALSRIEELDDYMEVLEKKKILTGKVLFKCTKASDLSHVGIDNELVQSVFFDHYLVEWKRSGVPIEMISPVSNSLFPVQ